MGEKIADSIVIFIISMLIISFMTFLSFITAFAHDEGTINETIGIIGYYSFYVFRFPSHNIIWLKPELIGKLFMPGLFINIIFYSTALTIIINRIIKKKNKAEGKELKKKHKEEKKALKKIRDF